MIVEFEDKNLEELFEKGSCTDKRYRFQPDIVRRFQRRVVTLQHAPSIQALWQFNSLNYEVLSGDKVGISSVRINNQYRLEFKVEKDSSDPKLTVCDITELSKHYRKAI